MASNVISRTMRNMTPLGRFVWRGIIAAERAIQSCVSASRKLRAEWPFHAFYSLCLCASVAILFSGCVSAHKKGRTVHERWDYAIVQPDNCPPQGVLTCHEIWRDEWTGGGRAFLSDPKASEMMSIHTNQTALGGSSIFSIGEIQSQVSTNGIVAAGAASSQVIQGIGAAAGQLINKSATGMPLK